MCRDALFPASSSAQWFDCRFLADAGSPPAKLRWPDALIQINVRETVACDKGNCN